MMKTIKIIDLLNMISKGEEVPKKIKLDNEIWNINYGEKNIYYTNDYDDDLFIIIFKHNLKFTLNDEVEILEDEKKIPEKLDINLGIAKMTPTEKYISNTVNEIIDYLESEKL